MPLVNREAKKKERIRKIGLKGQEIVFLLFHDLCVQIEGKNSIYRQSNRIPLKWVSTQRSISHNIYPNFSFTWILHIIQLLHVPKLIDFERNRSSVGI